MADLNFVVSVHEKNWDLLWTVCHQVNCSLTLSRLSETKAILSHKQEREKRKHKWLLRTEMYLQKEGDFFF